MCAAVAFSVFTKFWNIPLADLAAMLVRVGADGAELPVRAGYPVEPANAGRGLLEAAQVFADCGLRVFSIAPPDQPVSELLIAACGTAGVKMVRVMVKVGVEGYLAAEDAACRQFEKMVPELERHGVTIGVQNHCDRYVANAAGLRRIAERFDPRHVAAVYDVGHCALDGEIPELAIDLLWSHLAMVNLKNMVWHRVDGGNGSCARWQKQVVAGREGLAAWPDAAAELRRRNWSGVATICAEFEEAHSRDALLAGDLAFAKSLFA